MRQPTHCSRDKHLAWPVINKKKWKEIIFLPCPVCILRNGSVNKRYELQERRELSVTKLSLWLTCSTYNNARKKRKKITKKLMCINYTTSWYLRWMARNHNLVLGQRFFSCCFFNTYLSHMNAMSNYISNRKDFLLLYTNILSQPKKTKVQLLRS